MEQEQLAQIVALRRTLHSCPERAGREAQTKARLMAFLAANTSLTLHDQGLWFYAAHREGEDLPGVAFRADFDAVPTEEGAAHLCGHDGHAAALCGLALLLEGKKLGKNVFLLFQFGEENGQGGEACCALFDRERLDEVYGAHNLPGYPLGQILTRPGTMACASCGVTVRFIGAPAHAAYPENGRSVAAAVGSLLTELPGLVSPADYRGMVLCTVIGCRMGEKAFGVSAGAAEVWLTLRAAENGDFRRLRQRVTDRARALADRDGLGCEIALQDVFPATENTPEAAEKVLSACGGVLLPSPMRWSEDFGWYLQRRPGAFFGVGAGEDCPALHTAEYVYPDELLPITAGAFYRLAQAPLLRKDP